MVPHIRHSRLAGSAPSRCSRGCYATRAGARAGSCPSEGVGRRGKSHVGRTVDVAGTGNEVAAKLERRPGAAHLGWTATLSPPIWCSNGRRAPGTSSSRRATRVGQGVDSGGMRSV